MIMDIQRFTSSGTGTDATTDSLSNWWPRTSHELGGLSLSAEGPQQLEDEPHRTEPREQEGGRSPEEPAPQAPAEHPTGPTPDPAVLWMDRAAAALRVIKEAVALIIVLLPWILGIRPNDAHAQVVAQLDSAAAG